MDLTTAMPTASFAASTMDEPAVDLQHAPLLPPIVAEPGPLASASHMNHHHHHHHHNANEGQRLNETRVLTPPTSEDCDKKSTTGLPELSEDDEDWEVEPDHYWDGGKIPVFKPTMRQFRDFEKLIDKIDKYGMKSGIVKVIPPQEWRDAQPDLSEAVKAIRVKNPITQEFAGTHGTYTQANIEKQRSYNLPQWKNLTEETNHQPPARRGERRRQVAPAPRPARQTTTTTTTTNTPKPDGSTPTKRGRGRPRKNPVAMELTPAPEPEHEQELGQENVPPTPTSPSNKEDDLVETKIEVKEEPVETVEITPVKRGRGRPPKSKSSSTPTPKAKKTKSTPKSKGETKTSVSSRRMNNTQETVVIDEAAFEGFDYHMQDLDQFTPERCKELEEVYWKTINYGTPMYGADMPGSLFDDRTQCWNVAKLPNLLDALGTKVPGVNTAYLYLGMWKATFAWHLEDVDLYSINYIHFGAPKHWYSISQEDARRFEAAMRTIWPNDAKHCDQFLRHKTYLISPEKLKSQFNITVNKLIHYEGEFVITYPYGYHSGFNIGYNCAESVNFANESWLDYGRIAKKCECESDSVWVDVYEIERKLRGEPTPDFYEVTDDEDDMDGADHLPSPPPSESAKRGRKRKRDVASKDTGPKVKKVKIRIKAPSAQPCILCPNNPPNEKLLPTDNGKMAHRMCALYTPETFLVEENGIEMVCNVAGIAKARLELRCMYCRIKKGSCFQCSSKKCHRAYHATCAAPGGVQIDTGVVPTWDEDGTEYYCEGYDFRCRFHRPKRPKHADSESLERNNLFASFGENLQAGSVIQAQLPDGDIFAGSVVWNQPGERSCVVDVLYDGDRVEIEWKYLLVLDPADSLRPKPSPDAKPLPEHLLKRPAGVSALNRKDGVPSEGDPFHDPIAGQKWAQFQAATWREIRNPYQQKVNLDRPEQLWFYLGNNSTEAKAQYTQDLRIPTHNPRSNFLDSVKPAPVVYAPRTTPASYINSYGPPIQPRPDKPYQYKPRESMPQNNVYGQRLPMQHNHSSGTRTIAPQQMHYGYYPDASSMYPPNATAPSNYPGMTPWNPPLQPNVNKYGGATAAPQDLVRKPAIAPIDTAAAQAAKPPKLDNSPPCVNFYAQAEERYTTQRAQDIHVRYQELINGHPSAQPPPIDPSLSEAPTLKVETSRESSASISSNKPYADTVALASLRNMPPGSLPHSPTLTHMPFTPPSKRPDIKLLINNPADTDKPPKTAPQSPFRRPQTSAGPVKIPPVHKRSLSHADAMLNGTGEHGGANAQLDNIDLSTGLPHSSAHTFADRFGNATYQTSSQFLANLAAAPVPKSTTRFDEFIRQLQGHEGSTGAMPNGTNGISEASEGASGAATSSANGIPVLPAISAEQMDIFRDSVVFTPPPEAQKAHGEEKARVERDSPKGPAYSPLSEAGG